MSLGATKTLAILEKVLAAPVREKLEEIAARLYEKDYDMESACFTHAVASKTLSFTIDFQRTLIKHKRHEAAKEDESGQVSDPLSESQADEAKKKDIISRLQTILFYKPILDALEMMSFELPPYYDLSQKQINDLKKPLKLSASLLKERTAKGITEDDVALIAKIIDQDFAGLHGEFAVETVTTFLDQSPY